jgi:hypothetical protein
MKRTFVKQFSVALFALVAVMLCSSVGYGQAKINLSEGRWVSVGGGLRSSYTSNQDDVDGAYDQSFNIDSMRLYINSEFHKDFAIEVNTEYDSSPSTFGSLGEFRLLDAVVKYQPNEKFNIWMGRHLTPSDRSNLDGPYFLSIYDYPAGLGSVSGIYPSIAYGRDNGVSVSGKLHEGMFKYAFGIYEGASTVASTADSNLYAGRITFNLFDAEPDAGGKSGYYTGSTYYGEKDQILAIGLVAQFQDNIVLNAGDAKGFMGYNVDVLYEKKLSDMSVVTIEGAYYKYNVGVTASNFTHGSAYLLQGAYLFPTELGIGKLQPIVRFQDFADVTRLDFGSNYVIRGHNARLSFMYSPIFAGDFENRVNRFTGGAQFQF